MNLNYAIFRSEPIYTINDLAQIGSHNKREKKAYNSNPDIKVELSKDNIELMPLTDKYVKGFCNLTKEYKKEHDKRMKTERKDRKRTFKQMLDKSQNVVADELLFTATNEFFKEMKKEDIISWANTCMEFVYEDLGYTKDQVLHSVVHLDELTPYIHCVVVPLVRKLDKRTNTERVTISKEQYIKHLSKLQDVYNVRLRENGFELESSIKGSDRKHQKVKEYKKTTRYYENKVSTINKNLDNAMNDFEEKMKTTKSTIIDKEYVKVRKDTFDSMNNVIKEAKNAIEFQPKIQQLFNEVDNYAKSHQTLEKENQNLQKEIKALNTRNEKLSEENKHLKDYICAILKAIKKFFRELQQIGSNRTKEITTSEIKEYYDNQDFSVDDVKDIANGSTKEDELFDYVGIPSYLQIEKVSYDKEKDDYEIEL